MLSKIRTVGACAALSMSLSSCGTLSSLGVSQATIDAIQQAAVEVCGFLPTIGTIASIITGGMAAVPSSVASAICAAVAANQPPPGVAVGRTAPRATPSNAMVGTTRVQGVFVR